MLGDMADRSPDLELARDLLLDAVDRVAEGVVEVVAGLTPQELLWRVDPDANHVAWLVWHLSRQQDEQIAHIGGVRSAWTEASWSDRFGLPYDRHAHGYGMSSRDVGAFPPVAADLLTGYHADVHQLTRGVILGLDADDYERIIDRNWDPPVTVAVRLVSIVEDSTKHLGQAEYVRGLLLRRR